MLAIMVDEENLGFQTSQNGKFGFSQYVPHTLHCLFQSLFFIQIRVTIFRMCKSLEATHILLFTKLN